MTVQARHALPVALATAFALLATGCASSEGTGGTAPAGGSSSSGAGHAAAAGDAPSPAATMVCEDEVQEDLAATLRVSPTRPPTATWRDHLYSCSYTYPSGTMVLSVKELADDQAAMAYYAARKQIYPSTIAQRIDGQDAFTAPNGSVFVRKDAKVLQVDVSRLPARFGQPPFPRAIAAFNVASTVMGCWTGG
jgi:hypothetical protein